MELLVYRTEKKNGRVAAIAVAGLAVVLWNTMASASPKQRPYPKIESANATGIARTVTTKPSFDLSNPFFKPLGTNGRSCASCHALTEGLNMGPELAQSLFDLTKGLDPLFASVDGTNSPLADMSSEDSRRANTTMIRNKGLIRVGLTLPANAEFTIEEVSDPYGYASPKEVSAFRRPLPATNLKFLSSVMWDGRELTAAGSIAAALRSQVKDAVLGHMQAATAPSEQEISQIVDFETSVYTTQVYDNSAGSLDSSPVRAGPEQLIRTPFFPGINRFGAVTPRKGGVNSPVFTLFGPWRTMNPRRSPPATPAQLSIARGERLFNGRSFIISGVAGFNDQFTVAPPPPPPARQRRRALREVGAAVRGTCASCHNTPSVGSNSLPFLMNTGIADASRRTSDMPLYTLRNRVTGERIQTTDPGAAMTTGKWADIGKFKPPSLRAIETHSPYMHNGFSPELIDVVNFYDSRFSIGLTPQEKEDLKAFLQAL
jgi:cytochrome c peroxidase